FAAVAAAAAAAAAARTAAAADAARTAADAYAKAPEVDTIHARAAIEASRADYEFLKHSKEDNENNHVAIFAKPLWQRDGNNGEVSQKWNKMLDRWEQGLNDLGLDDIAIRHHRMIDGGGIIWGKAQQRINAWLANQSDSEPKAAIADSVPSHSDEPDVEDLLNRRPFAIALADRIRNIHNSDYKGAFLINLHGPWGSGKSTLLNLIEQELTGKELDDPWLVVRFNAWEQQNVGPAWWTLMDSLYLQGRDQLYERDKSEARRLWLKEQWWRFQVRRGNLIIAAFAVLWVLIIIFWLMPAGATEAYVKTVSASIGIIATVGGLVYGVVGTMFGGAAKAARTFSDATKNPAQQLSTHFMDLRKAFDAPLIIMIDDLDRCREAYVVELLESIQTLYRRGKVTYLVAADRRWLCASYQNQYKKFGKAIDEPGRPLGYLFLEKIFQLSATVPRLSSVVIARFWKHLIQAGEESEGDLAKEFQAALAEAKKEMGGLADEKDILAHVQSVDPDTVKGQALRQVAVKRLATPEVEKRTEHALLPFAHLLDGNPRSMKRLVNAYGIQRTVCLLAGIDIPAGELVLWTILAIRWPLLAERLQRNPEWINYILDSKKFRKDEEDKKLPPAVIEIKPLFSDQDVKQIIEGKDVDAAITLNTLKTLITLQSGEDTEPVIA
ncbi:MAG: hypothetical protein IID30_14330, partial [Planctomycetes bacterium]|nr:hypothetical protein [Planctomycetota bacterium]